MNTTDQLLSFFNDWSQGNATGTATLPTLSSLRVDSFQIGLPGNLSIRYSTNGIGLFTLEIWINKIKSTIYFGEMPNWKVTRIEPSNQEHFISLLSELKLYRYIDVVLA